jgi:thioredoxin-like negative regulator of GroEL
MKTGRLEEAAKAFTQALSLSQDDAEVYLHFAELELQLGHPDVVRGLLPALSGKRRDLSAKLQERLDQVIRQIPGATAP